MGRGRISNIQPRLRSGSYGGRGAKGRGRAADWGTTCCTWGEGYLVLALTVCEKSGR